MNVFRRRPPFAPSLDVLSILSRQCSLHIRHASVSARPKHAESFPRIDFTQPSCSTSVPVTNPVDSFEKLLRAKDIEPALDFLSNLPGDQWLQLPFSTLSKALLRAGLMKNPNQKLLQAIAQHVPLLLQRTPHQELAQSAALLLVFGDMYDAASLLVPSDSPYEFVEGMVQRATTHLTRAYTNWRLFLIRMSKIQNLLKTCTPPGSFDWTPSLFHNYVRGNLDSLNWQNLRLFLIQQPSPADICLSFHSNSPDMRPLSKTLDKLIEAYLSSYNLATAKRLLQLRYSSGYEPSLTMYLAVAKGYRAMGMHSDIYNKVLKNDEGLDLRQDPKILNALLETLVKEGEVAKGWQLFNDTFDTSAVPTELAALVNEAATPPQFQEKPKPKPTTATFAQMIQLFSIHRDAQTQPLKAKLWRIIRSQNTQMDETLAEARFLQAIRERDIEFGRRIVEWHRDRNVPSPWPLPFKWLRWRPSPLAYSRFIQAVLEVDGLEAAFTELEKMKERGVLLDFRVLRVLVQYYAWMDAPRLSRWIQRMVRQYPSSRHALAQLNHWVCYAHHYDPTTFQPVWEFIAKHAEKKAKSSDLPPRVRDPSYPPATAFGAPKSSKELAHHMYDIAHTRLSPGTPELLWTILRDQAVNAGVRPSGDHLNAIIISCYHANDLDRAINVLEVGYEMLGAVKSPAPFTTAILMQIKSGRPEEVDRLIKWMRELGIEPDAQLERVLAYQVSLTGDYQRVRRMLARTFTNPASSLRDKAIALTILHQAAITSTRQTGELAPAHDVHVQLSRMLRNLRSRAAVVADRTLFDQLKKARAIYTKGYDANEKNPMLKEGFFHLQKAIKTAQNACDLHSHLYKRLEALLEGQLFQCTPSPSNLPAKPLG